MLGCLRRFSIVEKTVTLKEDIDYDLLRSMREGEPMGLTGVQRRPAQENDAIPKIAPKWLKHDRQVSNILNPFPQLGQWHRPQSPILVFAVILFIIWFHCESGFS